MLSPPSARVRSSASCSRRRRGRAVGRGVAVRARMAVATGALFAAAPAWAMSKAAPLEALAGTGRSAHERSFSPRVAPRRPGALSLVFLRGRPRREPAQLEGQALDGPMGGWWCASIRRRSPATSGASRRSIRDSTRLRRVPASGAWRSRYSPMEGNNWSSGISLVGRAPIPIGRTRRRTASPPATSRPWHAVVRGRHDRDTPIEGWPS